MAVADASGEKIKVFGILDGKKIKTLVCEWNVIEILDIQFQKEDKFLSVIGVSPASSNNKNNDPIFHLKIFNTSNDHIESLSAKEF